MAILKMIYRFFIFFLLVIILFETKSYSKESDSLSKKQRNIVGLLPSKFEVINGIAVGLVGSEVYCDYKISKISNGLNLQIGQGLFLSPFLLYNMSYLYKKDKEYIDSIIISSETTYYKAKHNGLILSIFGSATDKINGMSLSGFFSIHKIFNGFSFSLLGLNHYKMNGVSISIINKSIITNGLQIGIYNNSLELKGIQLGLLNRNKKRTLPIINW